MFSKKSKERDKSYWDSRYLSNEINWDVRDISDPMRDYINQVEDKSLRILIPGAGNAYEAEYMHRGGFENVFVLDISTEAIKGFMSRFPDFGNENIIAGDFFEHKGEYDIILEQTFLCSLHPAERQRYFDKVHSLLRPGGKLVGVLFDRTFDKEGPPFGGSKDEYKKYFENLFNIKVYETAYNSIKPRAEKELFINLVKKG